MARFAAPADARVFLGRLTRLDPAAVVRLRPAGSPEQPRTVLWARLPWAVLVTRVVSAAAPGDVTVAAAALLASGEVLPGRRDHQWRWPLPGGAGAVLEEIPGGRVLQVAAAAAGALREATRVDRPLPERAVRDALLDHVAIRVEAGEARVEVPQRLVQAVVRMGFLGSGELPVRVCRDGRWVGLAAAYGTAWLPPPADPLRVRPIARR